MKRLCLLALLGAWLGIAMTLPQMAHADEIQTELHQLYKQKAYFDCLKKAHIAAKTHRKSPIPLFYAAIAVCHHEDDPKIRAHVKSPLSRALAYLEEAKRRDPSGRRLGPVRKGIAWMQKKMFNGAKEAWKRGNEKARVYFDRMHALFPSREGTWRNLFHGGRDLSYEGFDFKEWDHPFYRLADTGADFPGLSQDQRELIFLHNLCRIDPPRFERTYLRQYLKTYNYGTGEAGYIASLQSYLKGLGPRDYLRPDKRLNTAAKAHSLDQSRTGNFDHDGSSGESFSERLDRFKIPGGYRGENMQAGLSAPIDCFFSLLIDYPVKSLGHRYNIMSDGFNYIGIGISQKQGDWKIWVFDYSKYN